MFDVEEWPHRYDPHTLVEFEDPKYQKVLKFRSPSGVSIWLLWKQLFLCNSYITKFLEHFLKLHCNLYCHSNTTIPTFEKIAINELSNIFEPFQPSPVYQNNSHHFPNWFYLFLLFTSYLHPSNDLGEAPFNHANISSRHRLSLQLNWSCSVWKGLLDWNTCLPRHDVLEVKSQWPHTLPKNSRA